MDCELVLRDMDVEIRRPHTFVSDIRAGTFVRFEDRDWIVVEIRESRPPPEVICSPVRNTGL
jgi:hypothetical protein